MKFFSFLFSKVILVCPMKHAPVLVKLDGQHFSLPNGGEVKPVKVMPTLSDDLGVCIQIKSPSLLYGLTTGCYKKYSKYICHMY